MSAVDAVCTIHTVRTVRNCSIRSNSALDTLQRGRNACWLAIRRDEIVYDVLDEDAPTLVEGK
jgi:hypothetical protein